MNKKKISKDLFEFGAQINQSMNLDFVLEKIIEEKSLSLLSTKRATLYLLNENRELLIPQATLDPIFEEESLSESIPVKNSLSGKVVNTEEGKIFNNASKHANAYKIPGTSEDDEDEHLLVLPIKIDVQVLGTINFYRDGTPYSEEEFELAKIFSMYASVAIQNAMRNQQLNMEINDRNQIEEKLKISEKRYKNVIEHSNQMFYIHDDKHVLSYVSPQSLSLFGYTPKEMMVKWTTLVTDNPINLEGLKNTEKTLASGKESKPYLLEIKRKDGQNRLVKVFESPLKDDDGKIIGLAGSLEDVTDVINYENELIDKNEKLELFATIFENLNECITVTDKDHKIFYVNKAFKKLYGYKENEFLGKTVEFLRTGNDPELIKRIKKATNQGGWSGELINKKKDGMVFPIELSTTRIFDKDKNIVARIGIVRDISKRKKIEKELDDYKDHLENLVEERTEELEEKNKMLDSSVKVFVGREQTIIKLKDKIKRLEEKFETKE